MKQVLNTDQGGLPLFDRLQLFVRKNIPEMYTGYDGRTFEEIIDREARMLLNDSRSWRASASRIPTEGSLL